LGIVAGTFSCSLLEVPFLTAAVSSTEKTKKGAFKKASMFVAGLMTSYVFIGLFFGHIAKIFLKFDWITFFLFLFIGSISIYWGFKVVFNADHCHCQKNHCDHTHAGNFIEKLGFFKKTKTFLQIYLVGNIFAWLETPVCPCCGPVIYILSALTVLKGEILLGILTFAIYSFGQGIPVILFCVFFTHFINHPLMHKSKQYFLILEGNILILIGLVLLCAA
jgi:cytochrome c biogenesis protein CcdA